MQVFEERANGEADDEEQDPSEGAEDRAVCCSEGGPEKVYDEDVAQDSG